MPAALPIREDLSASELRALARRESKGRVAARHRPCARRGEPGGNGAAGRHGPPSPARCGGALQRGRRVSADWILVLPHFA